MGTISDKLTYLNTTKSKIKNAINLTGANLTNETFRQYPQKLYDKFIDIINNGTDGLYNNLPKVTGTGTELTLNNTAGAPMKLDLSASESTQKTTTGKNMFNKNATSEKYYYDASGVKTYDTAEHLFINQTYDNIDFNSICISFSGIVGYASVRVCEYNSNGTFIKRTLISTNGQSLNLDNNTTKVIFSTNAADDLGFVDLQIEKGSTATSYEEYTGGIASPNPDYPQNINVVTGENEIKIVNPNLWDEEWELGSFSPDTGENSNSNVIIRTKNHIPVQPNTTYFCYIAKIKEQSQNSLAIYCYDKNKNYLGSTTRISVNNATFNTPNNCYYIKFRTGSEYGTTYLNDICINISNASINGNYFPHKEQTFPLSLGTLELAKIGEYKDEIFQNTTDSEYYDSNLTLNGWYKKKSIGKYTFTGNEQWVYVDNNALFGAPIDSLMDVLISRNSSTLNNTQILSNKFVSGTQVLTASNSRMLAFSKWVNTKYVYFNVSLAESVNDFKTWLANNNVIVYFPLETPTTEQITDTTLVSQLNALKNAVSYANETNISQTNANRPFSISASAIKGVLE